MREGEDLDATLICIGGYVFLSIQVPTTPQVADMDLSQFVGPPAWRKPTKFPKQILQFFDVRFVVHASTFKTISLWHFCNTVIPHSQHSNILHGAHLPSTLT